MTALARKVEPTAEYLVPEERAVLMIEQCANQIFKATTLPDIKKICTQAEAIAAVVRKIDASERVKQDATHLIIMAERQLGEISRKLPQAPRGGASIPGHPTKRQILAEHGINHFRAATAEKLAGVSETVIASVIEKTKAQSVTGVAVELGIRSRVGAERESSAKRLARDAITLLDTCLLARRPPTQVEVSALRTRLSGIGVEK